METRQDTSELYAKLKEIAGEYNEKLGRLMVKAMKAYEAATERCALLKEISKSSEIVEKVPDQMKPAGENHSTQVKNLLKEGTHVQPGFKAAIERIVGKFNTAESTQDYFNDAFRWQPWLAIPFMHTQKRQQLRELFEVA